MMQSKMISFLLGSLFLNALSCAQEEMGAPSPAAELQQLKGLMGNWAGSGEANFAPGMPPVKWTGRGTYRWSHDGHFLQEDFEISFQGLPAAMQIHSYLGWDAERQRFAMVRAWNDGRAELHDLKVLDDGTILEVTVQHQEGVPYAERSILKPEGDKLTHSIDMLMPEGASVKVVDAVFKKTDKVFDTPWDAPMFVGGSIAEPVKMLARMAGTYDSKGWMIMAPGTPKMNITGTDKFRMIFGGTIMHGHTDGAAEGMPGLYASDGFFAYDANRGCLINVFVSNMGEIGCAEARFSEDGKALINTMSGTMMGQPMLTRFVIGLNEKGFCTSAVGHTMMGALPAYESFSTTYKKN